MPNLKHNPEIKMTFVVFALFSIALGSSFEKGRALDPIHLAKSFRARSCLDYLKHGQLENGFYWIFDIVNQRYLAYCDLSSEPGSAWTLVMSWNRASQKLPNFSTKGFQQDAPINQNTPNWNVYRQTLARMKALRSFSTHWRATCSFNRPRFQNLETSIDYRDYIRAKFGEPDVMTFVGNGGCFEVEYVNVRGHVAGNGTSVAMWQHKDVDLLHIDSSLPECEFNAKPGSVRSEDNFGFNKVSSDSFRCTAGDDATTQWWFGGYLA